jgi:chemotaxis protein CheZ
MPQQMHLGEAHEYLDKVIATLQLMNRREKGPLVETLEHLSNFIRSTRNEISSLRPESANGDYLSSANDELEQIINETANATNAIMSAAEDLEKISETVDEKTRDGIISAVTQIYEACAFQDITGQRITKTIRAIQKIEAKVNALASACGGTHIEPLVELRDIPVVSSDVALLNGPQLSGDAKSQAEIDQLFASA